MSTPAARLSVPPLPDYLPPAGESADDAPIAISPGPVVGPLTPVQLRTIRCGCWLVSYRPVGIGLVAYDGTMRVECHSEGRTASGDLYQRPLLVIQQPVPIPLPGPAPVPVLIPRPPIAFLGNPPNPAAGIPILPRNKYRYYMRVTSPTGLP